MNSFIHHKLYVHMGFFFVLGFFFVCLFVALIEKPLKLLRTIIYCTVK